MEQRCISVVAKQGAILPLSPASPIITPQQQCSISNHHWHGSRDSFFTWDGGWGRELELKFTPKEGCPPLSKMAPLNGCRTNACDLGLVHTGTFIASCIRMKKKNSKDASVWWSQRSHLNKPQSVHPIFLPGSRQSPPTPWPDPDLLSFGAVAALCASRMHPGPTRRSSAYWSILEYPKKL